MVVLNVEMENVLNAVKDLLRLKMMANLFVRKSVPTLVHHAQVPAAKNVMKDTIYKMENVFLISHVIQDVIIVP